MKTNHRRTNKTKGGHDYSTLNYMKRRKAGLSMDHDGGHKGSTRDIREAKTTERRQERRRQNKLTTVSE